MKIKKIKPILAFRHNDKKHTIIDKIETKIIKKWTNSKYYHVEIVIEDKWIGCNVKNGVSILDRKNFDIRDWDYITLDTINLTEEQYSKLWDFIKLQENKGYDCMGIFFSHFLKLNTHNEDKWNCSEITSKILQLLYVEEFIDIMPNNTNPQDIYDIVNIK